MKTAALIAFVLGLSYLGLYLTAPTQEQIDKCAETTNYTKERCEWEMTR